VVADVAGQFSLYALGPPPPLLLSAPYDQFFSRDYDPIVHDAAGFAAYADPDTGVVVAPVWQAARQYAVSQAPTLQQPLCDNHFRPYPESFQAAYRAGRVFEYVKSGAMLSRLLCVGQEAHLALRFCALRLCAFSPRLLTCNAPILVLSGALLPQVTDPTSQPLSVDLYEPVKYLSCLYLSSLFHLSVSSAGEGGMCLRGSSMTLTSSLEQWPPTVTAAVWKALEDRSKMGNKRNVPSEEATRVGAVH
jgi:hypothetical protein